VDRREPDESERREWEAEFEAAARRPLRTRLRYAFIHTFAPEETFDDAWRRRVEVEGFPVCHPDDIIRSKEAANRAKDRESLPRLRAFRDYWLRARR
jgi:hypothetical protein